MIIREAKCSDVLAVSKIHVDTWNTTYKSIVPKEELKNRTYEKQAEKWNKRLFNNPNTKEFMFVAENEKGEIVGFASASPENDDEVYDSILYTLYIFKEYQGKRIGKLLFDVAVKRLRELNAKNMIVWAFEYNSACKFYEGLGGKEIKSHIVNIKGKDIVEVAFGWKIEK